MISTSLRTQSRETRQQAHGLRSMGGMGFHWIAALTLWTLLIGPIMDGPRPERVSAVNRPAAHTAVRK